MELSTKSTSGYRIKAWVFWMIIIFNIITITCNCISIFKKHNNSCNTGNNAKKDYGISFDFRKQPFASIKCDFGKHYIIIRTTDSTTIINPAFNPKSMQSIILNTISPFFIRIPIIINHDSFPGPIKFPHNTELTITGFNKPLNSLHFILDKKPNV